MPAVDISEMLQHSRGIAEEVSSLSAALSRGDEDEAERAVDDLLTAYDDYTGKASASSVRFGFDEVAKISDPLERDQTVANALASALIEMDMAVMLGRAAQATGEIEGNVSPEELDESANRLIETVAAVEAPSDPASTTTRFAFDEVLAGAAPGSFHSGDMPLAKATFEGQIGMLYDTLVDETYVVIASAFKGIVKLDANKITDALKILAGPIDIEPVGKIIKRAVESLNRALDMLKRLLGTKLFGQVGERISKTLDEIRQGENIARIFLRHAYDSEGGQTTIAGWLKVTKVNEAKLDQGSQSLAELRQQMLQAFTIEKRIIAAMQLLSSPLAFILKKAGGTLPLDLLMGAAYLLVLDIAVLRGMDYADSSPLVSWVDGIVNTSRLTLAISEERV